MNSNNSSYSYTSMNKSMAETDTLTAEESGWTTYFEDFMVSQQQHHYNDQDHTNHDDQPKLSDAASHVEWNNIIANSMSGAAPKFTKKLNLFKKTSSRKTREILYDDSLEDTASSPVNSPKVGSQQLGFNQMKVDDIIDENSLGKGGDYHEDERREIVFQENNNIGSTELRKRGLCLVPLSMFVTNYI